MRAREPSNRFTRLPGSAVVVGVDRLADRIGPRATCGVVMVIVGVFWAPTIWRSTLLNWHIQTAYSQARLCEWPAWQEGFSTLCTHGEWFYRMLERRALKLPSTLWTHGTAHALGSGPLFYAGLWAAHVTSSVLVCALALRMAVPVALAALAGLAFGLHPAAAEVMVTGQFAQYVFGGSASLLALWIALQRGPGPALAGALALACGSDVTFLVTPVIVLLWVDEPRRFRRLCTWVLVLAALAHGAHGQLYPSRHHLYAVLPPVSLDDRLLRMLVVEPVVALRRLVLAWSPESGPWFMDAPTGELDGLGPLEPLSLAITAALLAAATWLVRRDLPTLVRLAALPIALLLADVSIRAGWSDVLASRWSGLRHVYVPVAFLALGAAACMRKPKRPRVLAAVGFVLLAWPVWLSCRLAERTWARLHTDELVFAAAVAKLEPLAIPSDATVYLFEVADARPFSMWQGTLRDRVGPAHFTVITHGITHTGSRVAPTRFTRTGPRLLELELCASCAGFLRPDEQPSWAGPVDPGQRLAHYLRRAGQLNMWPIFDPGVLRGHRVPVPGIDGADVRVTSIEPDRPVHLVLRARLSLDDPRTVLLVERDGGWARVSCPPRGECRIVAPP